MHVNIEAFLGALGVLVGWTLLVWGIIRPHFADKVLAALQDRAGDYKKWNDSLYSDWRDAQVIAQTDITNTHTAVQQVMRDISAYRDELKDHRKEVRIVLDQMASMPAALEHLANAITGLNKTIEKVDATTRIQGERIARLEAKP